MKETHLILIPILSLLFCSSCEDKQAVAEAQKEVEEFKRQLIELEAEEQTLSMERSEKSKVIRGVSSSFQRKMDKAENALAEANDYVGLLESESTRLDTLLETWEMAVKKSLIGRKVAQLTTTSGQQIENIVIADISDEELFYKQNEKTGSVKLVGLTEESLLLLLDDRTVAQRVEKY